MKKIILIVSILIVFSCSKSDSNTIPVELVGKWQLVEASNDTGETIIFTDGYIFELQNDGTFLSNELNGYSGGNFTIIEGVYHNTIKFTFSNNENQIVRYKAIIIIDNGELYLSDLYNDVYDDIEFFYGEQKYLKITNSGS